MIETVDWTFGSPVFLWGLVLVPFLIYFMFVAPRANPSLALSTLRPFFDLPSDFLLRQRPALKVVRLLAIVLLLLALARPQKMRWVDSYTHDNKMDILLVADVSLSMLAKDFSPDRLSVLKQEALQFVQGRKNARIGLLAYSGEVLVKVPLTFDKKRIYRELNLLHTKELKGGTALGDALGVAVNHLKHSDAKRKMILLMTDGVNNDGFLAPKAATELALAYGIKVYSVGIGTNGKALFPDRIDRATGEIHYQMRSVKIDEELLREIAQKTHGKYFRATDQRELQRIYQEIDSLDKSFSLFKLKYVDQAYFLYFAFAALMLLLFEFFLRATLYRNIL